MFYNIIIIQVLIAIFNLAMGYHLKDKMLACISVLIALLSLLYTVEYLNILVWKKYHFKMFKMRKRKVRLKLTFEKVAIYEIKMYRQLTSTQRTDVGEDV